MKVFLIGLVLIVSFSTLAEPNGMCTINGTLVKDLSIKENIEPEDREDLTYVLSQQKSLLLHSKDNVKKLERDFKSNWPQFFNLCPEKIRRLETIDKDIALVGALYTCTKVSQESCQLFGLTLDKAKLEVEEMCADKKAELYMDEEVSSIICR